MQPGDLLKRTFTSRAGIRSANSKILGILLEKPQFPTYGNYPKKYRVLAPDGSVQVFSETHRFVFEVISESAGR